MEICLLSETSIKMEGERGWERGKINKRERERQREREREREGQIPLMGK